MKNTVIVLLLSTVCYTSYAQSIPQDSLRNLGFVMSSLFQALDQDDHRLMAQQLSQLCLDDAGFDAINYNDEGIALPKSGNLQDFISNTGEFYQLFNIHREELQREINYYADIAHVSSLVYEVIERPQTSTALDDRVLYSINAIYKDNRWYISQVSWVSESSYLPFEQYFVTDTLTIR